MIKLTSPVGKSFSKWKLENGADIYYKWSIEPWEVCEYCNHKQDVYTRILYENYGRFPRRLVKDWF